MRRAIGMDIHRTFAEIVIWEQGQLRRAGRVDMTRTALEGFGKTLQLSDEVVLEATGNTMAVVRVLTPFAAEGFAMAKTHAVAHCKLNISAPGGWIYG